jgi:hypothetical protein
MMLPRVVEFGLTLTLTAAVMSTAKKSPKRRKKSAAAAAATAAANGATAKDIKRSTSAEQVDKIKQAW